MRSRMERYGEITKEQGTTRSEKNQELYTSVGTNARYANMTDIRNANRVFLDDNIKDCTKRENYQKVKELYGYEKPQKEKQQLDEFNHWYEKKETKIYDINSIIDEAKKNRTDEDAEANKKLTNDEYNVFANMNKEELLKDLEQRKKSTINDPEEVKELINTITTKTLCGELDQQTSVDLLSDLMATKAQDMLTELPKKEEQQEEKTSPNLQLDRLDLEKEARKLEEKIEKNKLAGKSETIFKDMDNDFYTRSMDLSDKDFDMEDDFLKDLKPKVPLAVKLLLGLILLGLIGILVFFIIKSF